MNEGPVSKPPYALGTDEFAFLEAALAEHPYPLTTQCACGMDLSPQGGRVSLVTPGFADPDEHERHLQVVAFTAGMRFQGTPPAGHTLIWMCPEPDCRERISVEESVLGAYTGEVIATMQAVQVEHYQGVHSMNVEERHTPSGIILP